MDFWIILAIVLGSVLAIVLIASYICFHMAFYVSDKRKKSGVSLELPNAEEYKIYDEKIAMWQQELFSRSYEEVSIRSFDGLRLYGKYYEFTPGAPVELLFHGYRSTAERDLSGGLERCARLGRNVILVHHRASGKSEGNVITFGVLEKRDALLWAALIAERFPRRKIILTGISMGAATVMMCAKEALPQNVVGILADCGYTSPRAIISKVLDENLHLPSRVFYPFVYLGARLFGGFDLHDAPPVEALAAARVPVLFFHGDADGFVPSKMSEENFAACAKEKKLVFIEGAGHGLAYPVNKEKYLSEMRAFFSPLLYEEK